ncbi:MAG: glutaminyl-peptide cyclotransferase [Alistipes sp.]|jgi:glutamine cyclotransferase|nr:glutaminyl-peptide cyclotransferase [Alistipes sp.]
MKYSILLLAVAIIFASCGGRGTARGRGGAKAATATTAAASQTAPVRYGYRVVASYPHDTGSYTQGLFWHEGALYESTGEYGRSTLRRVDLETGRATQRIDLPADIFAEGAALLGGRIYQITWYEQQAFVYDPATFERTGGFTYRGEGWGLATDGTDLYMSDGTPNITVRDPATFAARRTIVVRNGDRPVRYINEMEWIDGRLWANVYLTNEIVIIDPASGLIEGIVDLAGLASQLEITPDTDVMNGIAHDPATGRIFVTGKNWNRLFEIEIVKK